MNAEDGILSPRRPLSGHPLVEDVLAGAREAPVRIEYRRRPERPAATDPDFAERMADHIFSMCPNVMRLARICFFVSNFSRLHRLRASLASPSTITRAGLREAPIRAPELAASQHLGQAPRLQPT